MSGAVVRRREVRVRRSWRLLPHVARAWSSEIAALAREQACDRQGGSAALVALEQSEGAERAGAVGVDWRACHCGAAMPPSHPGEQCACCDDSDEWPLWAESCTE